MIDVPVLVKDALRDGFNYKVWEFDVLNDDGSLDFKIDNPYLLTESVKYDERMCSDRYLKFGLCEGTSLEFQYFDKPSILGRRINAKLFARYTDSDGDPDWYEIPMGFFTVEQVSRQASTGIMKATAFNKLQSSYLDQKANLILADAFSQDYTLSVFDIQKTLLQEYQIEQDKTPISTSLTPGTILNNYKALMGNFKFRTLYGIDTPLNAYMFGANDVNDEVELYLYSTSVPYVLGYSNYGIGALHGFLTGLEKNFVEWAKNLIEGADLWKETSGHLWNAATWDDVLDTICTRDGFEKAFGVSMTWIEEGTSHSESYSTVQWEYEEAHGLAHTVTGPISDIENRMINPQALYSLRLNCPYGIATSTYLNMINCNGTSTLPGQYDTSTVYKYYSDSGLSNLTTKPMVPIKYSDGTNLEYDEYYSSLDSITAFEYTNLPAADLVKMKISDMPDFTLRDILNAVYGTQCQYGKLDRSTDLFSGVELNYSQNNPADTLYPGTGLYPYGSSFSASKSTYSKLWADEGNVQKFRYLIITYKGLDENNQEKDFTLQRTVNADGTMDYNCSDNWLFRNLVWDAADIGDYADAMVLKMKDISWFPFEMWSVGLPYLETGDQIEIPMGENTYNSYILQRTLTGIQNLQDTYINGELDIF